MKWKPGDPPNLASRLLDTERHVNGARCQFCGRKGSQEWWHDGPAHTRCLDAETPPSAGELEAAGEQK